MTNKAKNKLKSMKFLTQPRVRKIIKTIDKNNENISRINRGSLRPQYI
jgi:hypothetical protein